MASSDAVERSVGHGRTATAPGGRAAGEENLPAPGWKAYRFAGVLRLFVSGALTGAVAATYPQSTNPLVAFLIGLGALSAVQQATILVPLMVKSVGRAALGGVAVAQALLHDPDTAGDLAHHLVHELARCRYRVHALVCDLARDLTNDRDLALDGDLARDGTRTLDLVLNRWFAPDFTVAHASLADAASNFLGADLTAVDLDEVSLTEIRWDNSTRWPTPEWAARIRRASVEEPPAPESSSCCRTRATAVPIRSF
ncbi:hypothetical protein [Streptomyces chartreusis]|uniref:hypothetical protein n=1 Tax=Streptomyces chartreusis TaxID=1969 RepID=UPI003695CA11